MVPHPDTDTYDGVTVETVAMPTRDGASTPTIVARPAGDGPFPAIAIGQEGTGPNTGIRRIAATLAHLGFLAIVPDYYRGGGAANPDDYDDVETLISLIDALDFTRAVHDLLDAIDFVQAMPEVDATRVATWGYCTGGTVALFGACLRSDLAASVVFFPSQPTFAVHDERRPVDVVDLLWNISCPLALLIGTEDPVLPAERLDDVRARLDQWGVDANVTTYEGGGHAFNAHGSSWYHREADENSWQDAVTFVTTHLRP